MLSTQVPLASDSPWLTTLHETSISAPSCALAGATMLSMPERYIQQLGLDRIRTRRARTTNGVAEFGVYSLVQLTIQGRDCRVDVAEVADDCPVLIGQIPLESLDFVVDPIGQQLIGNPEHGGEHMIDLF